MRWGSLSWGKGGYLKIWGVKEGMEGPYRAGLRFYHREARLSVAWERKLELEEGGKGLENLLCDKSKRKK